MMMMNSFEAYSWDIEYDDNTGKLSLYFTDLRGNHVEVQLDGLMSIPHEDGTPAQRAEEFAKDVAALVLGL